jgi:dTDP-4-dehydrorhamnose 3,5-epimerase
MVRPSLRHKVADVQIEAMGIEGAYLIKPKQLGDERGVFLELFKQQPFVEAVGHPLQVKQTNCSVSARGVVRGIHYALLPPSQAKYVACMSGAVFDVVIDVRISSPTYGRWEAIRLDDVNRHAVYIGEGLGHAFMAISDGATVTYLCSEPYNPGREFGIDPLDPEIGIDWPADLEPRLSPKDEEAPSLAEAAASGNLPSYDECLAFYEQLRT